MGFKWRAKQGLRDMGFKDHIWSQIGGTRREKREEKKRKKKKKRRRGGGDQAKGMETTLSMNLVWITWNLRLDMVNLLSLNLGF